MPEKKSAKRLHKIIAQSGLCSLREAERLIRAGRVSVNGETVTAMGYAADPQTDEISVDGKVITINTPLVYLAMYKPKGYVTTRSDDKDRKTVMELLPKSYQQLYPVGRLDIMSEGLLLFTNDGAFTQSIIASDSGVKRVYMVKVRNIPDKKTIKKMISGATIDRLKLKAESVELVEVTANNCWLKITLTEGKNRHIRRLCVAMGHPVLKLKRISIGPFKLGKLQAGESVHLKSDLVSRFKRKAVTKSKSGK